ncbi:MAG: bifunctional proline dehydrogenase/L-glutamate gamma-semialdehyde dehydrogenase [Kineosporiaceae bacterium]
MMTAPETSLVARAETLARDFLVDSSAARSASERRAARRMSRLVADAAGRDLVLDLTDRALRAPTAPGTGRVLADLVDRGLPASLGAVDRLGLRALATVAPVAPGLVRRLVDWRVAHDAGGVVLPLDEPAFGAYLRRRDRDGFRVNVNVLGEAILGDDEAARRCATIVERIARPDVTCVSVKISAVCANLDVLAEQDSLDRISARLRQLYRAAGAATPPVLVTLDMEEHRDLELSATAFMRVLGEPEFARTAAGIVLQAYLPDTHAVLETLCRWANDRARDGGRGIRIRLVKGANLAMETVEAELHGWDPAPYSTKADVDASFKAMLDTALRLGDPGAVRLGVASHNLFDVAWALTVRDSLRARDRVEIEMLEGMAPAQARRVREEAGDLLLYAPVVSAGERDASIAYLSRRLDENAGPENFLRHLFDLVPGSPAWQAERDRFRDAVAHRHEVPTATRRAQDRTRPAARPDVEAPFANTPDTDFTVPVNRRWIREHLAAAAIPQVHVVESTAAVDEAVARSAKAQRAWARVGWGQRRAALAEVARVMADGRGRTIAVMAHTTGKTVREGDPEVSEAVDFATYAAALTRDHESTEAAGCAWRPHPVTVVAGPWNFPYAIPACGVLHAVAAGGAVLLKPAPEARAVAALLVEQVTAAGLPPGLVQLCATPDDDTGRHLVTHPGVDHVVLTGSADTARLFRSWRPDITLTAETSGKNALVITAAADVDQAIADLVHSAFGHAGQKCSAASLAVVEAPLYDDPAFHARLADAVRSLRVGEATDLASVVGPLVTAPRGALRRALTTLEPGESWVVEPRRVGPAAFGGEVWTPGVRRDVAPGSWFHLIECFGPVLGLMRARDLDHALDLQNATEYGLTGGIHSLDPAEVARWVAGVRVGNAYVNRHITGAVVRRQPFGGWKASSVGAGWKPGGPNHLHGYGTWSGPVDHAQAAESYRTRHAARFAADQDPSGLRAESNVLRHVALDAVVARVATPHDPAVPLLRLAAEITGTPLEVVPASDVPDTELARSLRRRPAGADARLRLTVPAGPDLLRAAHAVGMAVDRAPVTSVGEVELPHWLKEQAVSRTMHRHGRPTGVARPGSIPLP